MIPEYTVIIADIGTGFPEPVVRLSDYERLRDYLLREAERQSLYKDTHAIKVTLLPEDARA